MGYSSKSGRATTNLNSPDAFKVCDRCGIWYNAGELQFQYEWAGNMLTNLRLLVCPTCLDVPQEQQRNLVLPPDPVPIKDPRLENFNYDANPSSVIDWDSPGATWDNPVNQNGVPINSWDNQILGTSEVPD